MNRIKRKLFFVRWWYHRRFHGWSFHLGCANHNYEHVIGFCCTGIDIEDLDKLDPRMNRIRGCGQIWTYEYKPCDNPDNELL